MLCHRVDKNTLDYFEISDYSRIKLERISVNELKWWFSFVVLLLPCSIQLACLVILADMPNLTNYLKIVRMHYNQYKYVYYHVNPFFIMKIDVGWHSHSSLSVLCSKTSPLTRMSYLSIDFKRFGDWYYA